MIILIAPGEKVRVPTQLDFLVRTATSFYTGELIGVVPVLRYRAYDGSEGSINGSVSGTDFTFPIAAGVFFPGEYTVNFQAIVSGKSHGWPEPAILDFQDPLKAGCDSGW